VEKEAIFGTVEAVKTVSELFMPVSGTVVALNPALENSPELVNDDPYGDGWMITIRPDNAADIESLLSADEYQSLIS
jgi:glycine cleavage system H protein